MRSAKTWQRLTLTALSIYPAVMIAIATVKGPGISIDSVSYAAAAESWASSQRLLSYDGSDLSIFPFGLPVMIGTLMAVGMGLNSAVIGINAVATSLTVLAGYFLGRQVLRSPAWALIAAAGMALMASTIRVGSFLWTEPVFSALIAWCLVLVAWAVRTRRGDWWIPVAAGVLVSAGTTFRYVGVVAAPVIALGVACAAPNRRAVKGLVAALVGSLGLLASAGRNIILGASPLGERYPGSVDVQGAILGLVRMWGEYLAPASTTSLTVVFGAIVLMLLISGSWLVVVTKNGPGILAAGFVAVYWTAILVSQVGTRLDVATERFGAPALIPSLVLVLLAVRSLLGAMNRQVATVSNRDPGQSQWWLLGAAAVAGALIVALSTLHAFRFTVDGAQRGLGLNSEASKNSALAVVAAQLPANLVVASNDPWRVWWSREGSPVLDYPPSFSEWPEERVGRDLDNLVQAVENEGSVLVVLDSGARASLPVSDLISLELVVQDIESRDGVQILEVRSSR